MDAAKRQRLKDRLAATVGYQIDSMGFVPRDLDKIASHWTSQTEPGEAPELPELPKDGDRLAAAINYHYDHVFYDAVGMWADLLGGTQFRNIGYWEDGTASLDAAGCALQDQLLAMIPDKTGTILDVACGMGASTKRLLGHFGAENIWAINISERQIASTLENVPGCNAQVMNATDLAFDDGFFDAIECIEAAFHFETRLAFLRESFRVLKPGGWLVMSDVLMTSAARLEQYPVFPSSENHLEGVSDYEALLHDVGFANVTMRDARDQIWRPHFLFTVTALHEHYLNGKIDIVELTDALWRYYELDVITGACPLIAAQKPV